MTVAIASYQRRESVMRLLRGLDEQFAASDVVARDVEVVVVLDGSTDGSKEAIAQQRWSVPVRVHVQPNRGLAAARNVGLEAAAGRLVWFLDDDLVPSAGLIARHRQAHTAGSPAVVVGPCRIPSGVNAPESVIHWWDALHAELERRGVIDRFDLFTCANLSAPAELLSKAGGFDINFVEYGMEDHELGVRLLQRGVPVRFDATAVAWHPDVPPISVLIERQYQIGLNSVRLVRLHPETVEIAFPLDDPSRARRLLRLSQLRSPDALMAVSRVALSICGTTSRFGRSVHRNSESLSRNAAYAAGVAAGDPTGELLARVLGYAGGVRSR